MFLETDHFLPPQSDDSFTYGAHSMNKLPLSDALPPWKRINGDKHSLMNVFTRRLLKTAKSASSHDKMQMTKQQNTGTITLLFP